MLRRSFTTSVMASVAAALAPRAAAADGLVPLEVRVPMPARQGAQPQGPRPLISVSVVPPRSMQSFHAVGWAFHNDYFEVLLVSLKCPVRREDFGVSALDVALFNPAKVDEAPEFYPVDLAFDHDRPLILEVTPFRASATPELSLVLFGRDQ